MVDDTRIASVGLVRTLSDDLREGADGTIYESAGAAVRAQAFAGVDKALSVNGKAADAKITGDVIRSLSKNSEYKAVSNFNEFTSSTYYDINGQTYDGGNIWHTTPLLPCFSFRAISFDLYRYNSHALKMCTIAFFDENNTFISGVYANYMPIGESEFIGQCAIPDNAVYFCAMANLTKTTFTPNVTLHAQSVEVDLTDILTTNSSCFTRAGSMATFRGWYTTQFVPVDGFKSLSFRCGAYHSGDTQLESVTFFGATGARIDGVFTNISNNNPRDGFGVVPIPDNAKWVKLLYNSASTNTPYLILHNTAETPLNIVCIGDSLTEGYTANSVVLTDNYPKNMQENLGLSYTVFNAGVGGSQAITWYSTWKDFLNLQTYNTDIIIIMLGANGGINNTFETDVDAYTHYSDYANTVTGKTCALIEWLQEQVPNALIVFATPTYIDATKAAGNAAQADRQCLYMSELVDRYFIPVIDIRNSMGINPKNSDTWLSSDGLHGTTSFYEKLGMLFANQIKPIVNIKNK